MIVRLVVPSAAVLDALAHETPPDVRLGRTRTRSFEEAYYDTVEDSLECRGVSCRVRVDGSRASDVLVESRSPVASCDAPPFRAEHTTLRREDELRRSHARDAALGWLATLVDVGQLQTRQRAMVRRTERRRGSLMGRGELLVALDAVVALDEAGQPAGMFFEASIEARDSGELVRDAEKIAEAWMKRHALERAIVDRRERAREARGSLVRARAALVPSSEDAALTETGSTLVSDSGLLDPDLSLLAFIERVMSLASDPRVPALERVRFLAIAGAGLDEFHMVRVTALARASGPASRGGAEVAEERRADARGAAEQRSSVGERVAEIHARQTALTARALRDLATAGVRIREWREILTAQQEQLRALFRERVLAKLITSSVTLAPGHPFPRVPHLALSLAVVGKDRRTETWHVSQLDLPREVERFVPVPGSDDYIAIEEVVRANVEALYPELEIEGVHAFRMTRGGELPLEEELGEGLNDRPIDALEVVSDATRRRPYNAVVRLEVDRAMPASVRRILLALLRLEPGVAEISLGPVDVYDADSPIGVAALAELAELPRADLSFPAFRGRDPLDASRSVAAQVAEGDVVVHHPYERFEASTLRLLEEAAKDPATTGISITLYRTGEQSPIVEALLAAARDGKRVRACLELQARFDEERNVAWARRLEEAGVRVAYGVSGLKMHAKAMLIERREDAMPPAIVHVASGNYNARTARAYTDLALLSSRPSIVADARAFFAALVKGAAPSAETMSELVAAPFALRPHMLDLVRRETANALQGLPARIRMKLNGLSDAEMVEALYLAARAGVEIALVVRGVCTLRPGVPDLSERITVVSAVGRFLEHARIYEFANGSIEEPRTIYIGSADWRPRNLRRRVELVAPVVDSANRAKLSAVLDLELADPSAWELGADGVYRKRRATRSEPGAQEKMTMAVRQ